MLATEIIAKKRDSEKLSAEEIRWMINGMVAGVIPDYQVTAWAMAVLCRGMTAEETSALTDCMLASGCCLPRLGERPRVDKHSTGGLGDKTSLILAPLLACFDLDVPMLSGRGLGITGGTLDKLESYRGYRCDLSLDEICRQLSDIGCVITGTTPDIAPADRRLYALRDVSGTVPSVPLITASILSKKLAESLDGLVLDVKFGSGAFMQTLDRAQELAECLKATSRRSGLTASVVMSDMNQPLGRMVGNACEANEAVGVLQGQGPGDVRKLTLRLSAELLVSTGRAADVSQATQMLEETLDSGQALRKYIELIEAQGGRFTETLPLARKHLVQSKWKGYVASMHGQQLGHAVIALGGGRTQVGDQLDHSVGLEMHCRVGDAIEPGQPLCTIFAAAGPNLNLTQQLIETAIVISPEPTAALPLIPLHDD